VPTDILSWKIIGGVTSIAPSTASWSTKQLGAIWFNSTERAYKFWDGVQIQTLRSMPGLLNEYQTIACIDDDFLSGINTSGNVGSRGWGFAGGTCTYVSSEANHPGIIQRDSGGIINTVTRTDLNVVTASLIDASAIRDLTYVGRLEQVDTDTQMRWGAINSTFSSTPANGVYFEKLGADVNWFAVTRAVNVQTRVDTGIAVDTSFHAFRYGFTTGVGMVFAIDGTTVATINATIPTVLLDPSMQLVNLAAANKLYSCDYFQLYMTGLVR